MRERGERLSDSEVIDELSNEQYKLEQQMFDLAKHLGHTAPDVIEAEYNMRLKRIERLNILTLEFPDDAIVEEYVSQERRRLQQELDELKEAVLRSVLEVAATVER